MILRRILIRVTKKLNNCFLGYKFISNFEMISSLILLRNVKRRERIIHLYIYSIRIILTDITPYSPNKIKRGVTRSK